MRRYPLRLIAWTLLTLGFGWPYRTVPDLLCLFVAGGLAMLALIDWPPSRRELRRWARRTPY